MTITIMRMITHDDTNMRTASNIITTRTCNPSPCRIEGDVDPEKFLPWLNDYVQKEGPSILRSKGILAFKDEPKRFVFQGVHMILDGDLQRDWKPAEKRLSRVVFIGRNLKEDEIRQGFLACAA